MHIFEKCATLTHYSNWYHKMWWVRVDCFFCYELLQCGHQYKLTIYTSGNLITQIMKVQLIMTLQKVQVMIPQNITHHDSVKSSTNNSAKVQVMISSEVISDGHSIKSSGDDSVKSSTNDSVKSSANDFVRWWFHKKCRMKSSSEPMILSEVIYDDD